MKEAKIFYPTNTQEWRAWLQENHDKAQSVWVVFYKIKSGVPTLSWSEAVDEALCFGWIDSKKVSVDHEKSHQFFSKRKSKSTWSKINKDKIERLITNERMTDAGLKSIEIAKENGSWTILDAVEALLIPDDLVKAFTRYPGSLEFFEGLSKSIKKQLLYWLVSAKREETRQNRIMEIAERAGMKLKPKQF